MPDGLIYVMAGAVIVSALALLLQLLVLYALYRSAQSMNARLLELLPRIQKLLDNAEAALTQSRDEIADVTGRLSSVLELTRRQLMRADESLGEVMGQLRMRLERAGASVDDSLTKLHDTVSTIHNGVVRPLREVSGMAAAIRAVFHTLTRGGRPTPAEATHDEEMFI